MARHLKMPWRRSWIGRTPSCRAMGPGWPCMEVIPSWTARRTWNALTVWNPSLLRCYFIKRCTHVMFFSTSAQSRSAARQACSTRQAHRTELCSLPQDGRGRVQVSAEQGRPHCGLMLQRTQGTSSGRLSGLDDGITVWCPLFSGPCQAAMGGG